MNINKYIRKFLYWKKLRILIYKINGKIPWSIGYEDYKWNLIKNAIIAKEVLVQFEYRKLINGFGKGVDERIVEYPWIFANMLKGNNKILDAGSTFNYKIILENPILEKKELSILTFYPELRSYNEKRISYIYSDLRAIPYKDEWFDEIICQSTIEHIDMDNSIYGYGYKKKSDDVEEKNFEYIKVIKELVRVLKKGGLFLLTFPYGYYEYHGFFQQFDADMLDKILKQLTSYNIDFFKYSTNGWQFASQEECNMLHSYNPHSGKGKGTDGAAHCRGICCIRFIKS